jgi:alcohol dehydrogenase class IV
VAASIADKAGTFKENAENFIFFIREMSAKMGIPNKISELKKEDISILAKRAVREANPLYPVPIVFSRKKMEKVYHHILLD